MPSADRHTWRLNRRRAPARRSRAASKRLEVWHTRSSQARRHFRPTAQRIIAAHMTRPRRRSSPSPNVPGGSTSSFGAWKSGSRRCISRGACESGRMLSRKPVPQQRAPEPPCRCAPAAHRSVCAAPRASFDPRFIANDEVFRQKRLYECCLLPACVRTGRVDFRRQLERSTIASHPRSSASSRRPERSRSLAITSAHARSAPRARSRPAGDVIVVGSHQRGLRTR